LVYSESKVNGLREIWGSHIIEYEWTSI
jgi:hypothetical protein